MAVSRAMRRLLRIRTIEEEQSRLELEGAQIDLGRLRDALDKAVLRGSSGRRLFQAGVYNGELPDRLAGLEETRGADRRARALTPHIADAEQDVAILHEEFRAKRIDRRQAETLIEEADAQAVLEAARRTQQALDDWFRNMRYRAHPKAGCLRGAALEDGDDGAENLSG
jgi:hypothetical protein